MEPSPEPEAFGPLLRCYRLRAGMTQERLATRAGVAMRTVPGLEAGEHRPQRGTLRRIADALALTADQRRCLDAASGRAARPRPETRGPRPNLPVQLTSFIGRDQEVDAVVRQVTPRAGSATVQPRLVTLVGTGGCGKTRLALEVAARVQSGYVGGVWFVDLAPLSDPCLVPQTVLASVNPCQRFFAAPLDVLIEYLRARHGLLLLDNCEHMLDACAELADALLRGCPELRILATSRQALRVAGEFTRRVPSMAVPDPDHQRAALSMADCEAVRLFVERARAVRSGFRLTDSNAAQIARVCTQLDGIPLAIELAAARVRALSVQQLADRIGDRLQLLTGGIRTASPRQQTLRATLAWSYDLLSEQERCLFDRLSVFAGGWTLDAAEAVCADEGPQRSQVIDLLTRLVDQSLVVFADGEISGHRDRYRLLETLRQYGQERLDARSESDDVHHAHAAYFLRYAEALEPHAMQLASLQILASDLNNLRVALRWLLARGAREDGLRLASALGELWSYVGRPDEGYAWLQSFLALRRGVTTSRSRAKARCWAGALALMFGDAISGRGLLLQSLAYARCAHDDGILGEAALRLGLLTNSQGDYAAARQLFEESLAARRRCHSPEQVVRGIHFVGLAMIYQGEYSPAEALLKEGRAVAESTECHNWTAAIIGALGLVAATRGETGAARRLYLASLRLFHESMDWPETSAVQNYLAALDVREGNVAAARAGYAASLALSYPARFIFRLTQSLDGLAILAVAQGASERALRIAAASARVRDDAGYRAPPCEAEELMSALVRARKALGDLAAGAASRAGEVLSLDSAIEEAQQP